jgi:hypothetical protein
MPVTAMPFGVLFPCITCPNNRQLNFIRRSFIVSILAALSIGSGSYLYSASASSLSRKLRSLSLRAILRQDSKSVSYLRDAMPLLTTFTVEYFDRDENNVRTMILTESVRLNLVFA